MKVAYYTSAYFLDEALETIQSLKSRVTLDVYIEISEYSKKSTLLDLDSIAYLDLIEDPLCVIGNLQWESYQPYFEGVNKVKFVVKLFSSLSFKSLKSYIEIGKVLRSQTYDVIHFDNLCETLLGIIPFIKKSRKCLTVHDPINHAGEFHLTHFLFKKLYINYFDSLHFFSNYSSSLFKNNYIFRKKIVDTPLQPYTFLNQFSDDEDVLRDHILFYGRISKYKGLDLLINAIPIVLMKFPNQRFIIAGKINPNLLIDYSPIEKFKKNVVFYDDFISTPRLVKLLQSSKFVVCPYKEASQSGVLMSCFALKRMVVATRVGAFPEYINDHCNGLLCATDSNDLAKALIEALTNNYYLTLENNIQTIPNEVMVKNIGDTLVGSYY